MLGKLRYNLQELEAGDISLRRIDMKKHPIIGVISAKNDPGTILPVYSSKCHYLEQIQEAGGVPIQLPIMSNARADALVSMVNCCDGFLLPGGGDFFPEWYGQTLLPGLGPDSFAMDMERQKTTLAFVREMAASGKPILGICLGMQVITIAFGGDLYQDIPTQIPSAIAHNGAINTLEDRWSILHTVQTSEGSLLRRLTGAEEIPVNSFHHQAVKTPAPGFTATAFASDGVIEAVESDTGRILGVQWHPENLAHAGMEQGRALFRWLVETAAQ